MQVDVKIHSGANQYYQKENQHDNIDSEEENSFVNFKKSNANSKLESKNGSMVQKGKQNGLKQQSYEEFS